ncbi:MAG: transglutaminase domain protein, partial [Polaromonas sp.]|nr:transglutaminase domain protein [Polaromonas sp.]
MTAARRSFLKNSAAATLAAALPGLNFAQTPVPASAPVARSTFAPQSGAWRTFEVTTRVDLKPEGASRVWLPIPSVNSDYQHSLESSFTSNGAG